MKILGLSESGALLWEALQAGATKEQLVNRLTEEYDVTAEVAQNDVEAFLSGLAQQGVLI